MHGLITFIFGLILLLCVVFTHHETLSFVSNILLPQFKTPRRWHVAATVLILIIAHIIEILIYALGLYAFVKIPGMGQLAGELNINIQSFVYFSFASYTSLGIGDIYPMGYLRILTGLEALIGLLMIGWSASFLLLEMREFWTINRDRKN